MVIGIFGESCTGKSTLAEDLKEALKAQVYTGKDFLRLAKSESQARSAFQALLARAAEGQENVIYVISAPEHLELLPPNCLRVLVTAPLEEICRRFDDVPWDLHIVSGEAGPEDNCAAVLALCGDE